jgi:hypothetical protein
MMIATIMAMCKHLIIFAQFRNQFLHFRQLITVAVRLIIHRHEVLHVATARGELQRVDRLFEMRGARVDGGEERGEGIASVWRKIIRQDMKKSCERENQRLNSTRIGESRSDAWNHK